MIRPRDRGVTERQRDGKAEEEETGTERKVPHPAFSVFFDCMLQTRAWIKGPLEMLHTHSQYN